MPRPLSWRGHKNTAHLIVEIRSVERCLKKMTRWNIQDLLYIIKNINSCCRCQAKNWYLWKLSLHDSQKLVVCRKRKQFQNPRNKGVFQKQPLVSKATVNDKGLNVRKPVFRVIHLLESIISILATSKISIFKLVTVAVEIGLNLTLSETP